MERLTERFSNGQAAVAGCGNNCKYEFKYCEDNFAGNCPTLTEIYEKLAKYEELEERDKLIRLPCKIGNIVYNYNPYTTIHTGIQPYEITNIMISQNKKGEWTKKYRAMLLINGKTIDWQMNFKFDDIGKTVFLTKEAEKALAEMGK